VIYLGLNLGLKKVGENAQVLWNDGGQGRSYGRRIIFPTSIPDHERS
jgi:hypothetical protein